MEIHMKKPIHLYIFAILSTIASLIRVKGSFFTTFNEEEYRAIFQGFEMEGLEDLVALSKATVEFSTNMLNKAMTVVLLLLIIAVIFFLFKKANEKASYTYIAYLFLTLIYSTYAFIGTNQISRIYETAEMHEFTKAGALTGFGINIALFVIYFGVTVFFLLKKPKETPNMGQTATDI